MIRMLVISQPDSGHTEKFLRRIRAVLKPDSLLIFPSSPMPFSAQILALAEAPVRNKFEGRVHPKIYWRDLVDTPLSAFSGDPTELRSLIRSYNPSHIHVNAIQDAGYLLEACLDESIDLSRVHVSLSIWGIDLAFFQHSANHRARIVRLLGHIKKIFPECSRDINICRELGFSGTFASIMQAPLTSSEDYLLEAAQYNQDIKINRCVIKNDPYSARSFSHVFLYCLANDDKLLRDYQFTIIAPSQAELNLVHSISLRRGPVISVTGVLNRHAYLSVLSSSKLLVSLTLSDGIPNSFLEALALGVFPFFSSFSGLQDWKGRSCFVMVNPYSQSEIREALLDLESLLHDERGISERLARNRESLDIYSEPSIEAAVKEAF